MKGFTRAQIAWTGVAALLLSVLPWVIGGTRFEWLGIPLWAPGFFLAAVVFQQGAHDNHANLFFTLAVVSNFAVIWLVLLAVLKLLEKFINRKREHA